MQPSSRVEHSLAELQVARYGNQDGSVDEVTFCKCLASSKTSRGCLGFTHDSVGAAIQHLNAAKCCAVDHRLYDPFKLLAQLPPRGGGASVRPKKARVRRVGLLARRADRITG